MFRTNIKTTQIFSNIKSREKMSGKSIPFSGAPQVNSPSPQDRALQEFPVRPLYDMFMYLTK